jgi:hypothetical protein
MLIHVGYKCWISMWQLPNPVKLTVIASPAGNDPPTATSTFEMSPSVVSSGVAPYGVGPQTLSLRLACLKPTGEVVRDCDVALAWNAQARSGGHVHDTNRPPGAVETEHGVGGGTTGPGPAPRLADGTGPSGILGLAYTAPEASGLTSLVATGSAVVDGVRLSSDPMTFTIRVRHGGLAAIAAPGVQVKLKSSMHGTNNGNGTPALGGALAEAASRFAQQLAAVGVPAAQVPAIRVTAISLPDGGLFDFSIEWSPPHRGHRLGTDADIGMAGLTFQQKKALAIAVHQAGLQTPVLAESPSMPAANHWHVSL